MSKVITYVARGRRIAMFFCPACGYEHQLNIREVIKEIHPSWVFNENAESPTFTPSVLVTYPQHNSAKEEAKEYRCYSFITDGKIKYLSDCTHKFAGRTVELPDIDKNNYDLN